MSSAVSSALRVYCVMPSAVSNVQCLSSALRVCDDNSMPSYAYDAGGHDSFKPGLNINAKEFVSLSSNGTNGFDSHDGNGIVSFSGPNGLTSAALKHSKSSAQVCTFISIFYLVSLVSMYFCSMYLYCANGAQGVLPCNMFGITAINSIYRL